MGERLDLRTTLGAAPLQRDVVRAAGADAVEFLQGQLSQDVRALAVGDSARALLLQPNGKVDAWLRITRIAEDEVLLDVEPGFGGPVVARLERFKLRTKVELTLERWAGLAVRGPVVEVDDVPAGALALPAAWPGVQGIDLLSAGELAVALAPLAEPADLEALRIECGVPAMGAELTEATIPAEAGQWVIDTSVSFTKGCYTGQELVARIDSRGGNVPRPVRGLLVEGEPVPVGSLVLADGAEVGRVSSSAQSLVLGAVALAPLARAVLPGAAVELRCESGILVAATVASLPLR